MFGFQWIIISFFNILEGLQHKKIFHSLIFIFNHDGVLSWTFIYISNFDGVGDDFWHMVHRWDFLTFSLFSWTPECPLNLYEEINDFWQIVQIWSSLALSLASWNSLMCLFNESTLLNFDWHNSHLIFCDKSMILLIILLSISLTCSFLFNTGSCSISHSKSTISFLLES